MMASKKELRAEIDLLRRLTSDFEAKERARADRAHQEFTDAIASIPRAENRRIRIIAPNGTILWALVAETKIDHGAVGFAGEMIPGLLDVTLILHPEPNR